MKTSISIRPICIVFVSILMLPCSCLAADLTSLDISQVEQKLNDALVACDARVLTTLWDDDLTFVFPNGVAEDKKKRLAGLADCVPGKLQSIVETISTKFYGNVGVAIVLSGWASEINGKPFAAKFRATHVWARKANGIVLVAAHVSQIK